MASHAGTPPLERRQDGLLGAARKVKTVREAAEIDTSHGRIAVGKLFVPPNSHHMIPGQVTFNGDMDCGISKRPVF